MLHGAHPQQPERAGAGFGVAAGAALHPQPVPPVALTSASRAHQAAAPSGAGPPQQPLPETLGSVGVVTLDMMASSLEAAFIAALSAEDAGPADRTQPSPSTRTNTSPGNRVAVSRCLPSVHRADAVSSASSRARTPSQTGEAAAAPPAVRAPPAALRSLGVRVKVTVA